MALTRRKFTREFKLAAVKLLDSGKSVARVARELELHENVLRRWQRELEEHPSNAFPGLGQRLLSNSREAELERKIGQMTLENDFLKKALQRLEEQRLLSNAGGGRRSTSRSKQQR
ncbi:MAG TPA: transposase [Pyrinomonadaceae bacterium]|nr:transposase [Pyrinomonadaceae bacterium]